MFFNEFSFGLGDSRSARQNETKSFPVPVALIGAALILTLALLNVKSGPFTVAKDVSKVLQHQ